MRLTDNETVPGWGGGGGVKEGILKSTISTDPESLIIFVSHAIGRETRVSYKKKID